MQRSEAAVRMRALKMRASTGHTRASPPLVPSLALSWASANAGFYGLRLEPFGIDATESKPSTATTDKWEPKET